MKYHHMIELSVEMPTESQWDSEVVTEKQNAAIFSCVKLKSDPWECYSELLKTFVFCMEGII